MRKWVIGGAAALALASAGGVGLWSWGKGRIEREIDARLAAVSDRVEVGWASRSVEGFPPGYVVRFERFTAAAPDGAWTFAAPWIEVTAGLEAPDRVAARMAPEATLTLTPPAGGEPLSLSLSQTGLLVEREAGETGEETRLAVERLVAETAEDAARAGRLEIGGADLLHNGGAPGVHVFGGEMREAAVEVRAELPRGRVVDGSVRLTDARVEGKGTALDAGDPAAFATAPGGGLEVRVEAASVAAETSRRIAPDAAPFRRAFSSGAAAARVAIGGGRAGLAAEAEDARYASGAAGAVLAERASIAVETPVAPEAPPEWSARFEIAGARPDDALRAALDPEGALPAGPANATIELGGEAEIGGPDGPARARTVELREARIEGFGVAAEASGRVENVGAAGAPEGVVTLRAEGVAAFLDALAEGGLLAPDQRALADMLLSIYARKEAETGALVAEIALRDGAVFANGQKLR